MPPAQRQSKSKSFAYDHLRLHSPLYGHVTMRTVCGPIGVPVFKLSHRTHRGAKAPKSTGPAALVRPLFRLLLPLPRRRVRFSVVTGPDTELPECHQERTLYIGTSRQEVRFSLEAARSTPRDAVLSGDFDHSLKNLQSDLAKDAESLSQDKVWG